MSIPHSFQECRSYVRAQLQIPRGERKSELPRKLPTAVTISRQAGARGHSVGNQLVAALRQKNPDSIVPWTLFDRDLVTQILDDHQLPRDLAKFMPDDRVGELESAINEILGLQPSSWTLFEYTVDTIIRLARLGHSIIVGRGGSVITRSFPNVLHIRLIGSFENRVNHMVAVHGMSEKEAVAYIRHEDSARQKFLKQHFNRDIDDPHLYNLVINSDSLTNATIVQTLIAAVEAQEQQLLPARVDTSLRNHDFC